MDTFREWFSYSWDWLKCPMWSARIWSRDTFIHGAVLSPEGRNLHHQPQYVQSDYPTVQADTNWCQRQIITGISMALCLNKYTCPFIWGLIKTETDSTWPGMSSFPRSTLRAALQEACTQRLSGRPQAPRDAKRNAWSSPATDGENQATSEDRSQKVAS